MTQAPPSAGEHEWREIKVLVHPSGQGARYSVHLRRHRGGNLIWDRRLCTEGVPLAAAAATTTVAGALRAVAACLAVAADRVDDLS